MLQEPMIQCALSAAQWQVVMQALLHVNAPMATTGPVYNSLARQLEPAQRATMQEGASDAVQ